MLEDMTARQLDGWLSWLRRYHVFPNRNDKFFAMLLASWSVNSKPQDFLIYDDPLALLEEEEITAEELAGRISSLIPKTTG